MKASTCIWLMVGGALLSLGALWFGSYFFHYYHGEEDWQAMPIFITSLVAFMAGAFCTIGGLVSIGDAK